jgi:uncharacterized protein DUF3810
VYVRIALIVAAAVVAVAPLPPRAVERFYSTGAFPPLQRALTSLSNRAPFALLDVAIIFAVVWWLGSLARDLLSEPRIWRRIALRVAIRTFSAAAAVYLLFIFTWGLNYRRVPLTEKVPYDRSAVTPAAARELARRAVAEVNALYASAHGELERSEAELRALLADGFSGAQQIIGVARQARPARPKHTLLDLYFRAAGVEGMTDPFFLETLTARGLLPVEQPAVIAHEWSHLAGFADEGEANFVGWLACVRSMSGAARYSGWLFLYREIAAALPAADRAEISQQLADGPRGDLRAIADRIRRQVRPAVSNAGWRVYDQYLKANRVDAGTESYAQVVRLVLGTRDAGYY